MKVNWKNGKKFAFTFCDDPDFGTLENVRPIYDFLEELGMRTTKLVWLTDGGRGAKNDGDTCEDPEYLSWIAGLQEKGFEIALHNIKASSSVREEIELGLENFRSIFGSYPRLHCNHTGCLDNLYWGDLRVSGWRRSLYNLRTRGQNNSISFGQAEQNKYFWGDICRERIAYVRNYTCDGLNTLRFCPQMPYHDEKKPFVSFWFSATNASSPRYFRQNFTMAAVDKLIEEGGLCVAYVHFGTNFFKDGKIDPNFLRIMDYVAANDGWFAPVSEILDFLRNDESPAQRKVSTLELQMLELKWLIGKLGKKVGI